MPFGVVLRTFYLFSTLAGLAIRTVNNAFHEIIICPNAREVIGFKTSQDSQERVTPCSLYPLGYAPLSQYGHENQRAKHRYRVTCTFKFSR